MGQNTKTKRNYISETKSNFKRGIDLQRERFKMGKIGTGINNFDLMCDSIENIKSDVKSRFINDGYSEVIRRIEKIIDWYRNKELRYSRNTEDGYQIVYPPNMTYKINKNLTIAYELLVKYLDKIDLL